MKLEAFKQQTSEIFVQGRGVQITATPWANAEGVNVMIHGKDLSIRAAMSLRWEEMDVLLVALNAARAV